MGKIIRLMSIQLSLRFRGMTGWKARTFWTRLYGPMLKFVVFRIGTLIKIGYRVLRGLEEFFIGERGALGRRCRSVTGRVLGICLPE